MSDDLDLGLQHEQHDPPRSHRGDRPRYGRRRFAMALVAVAVVAIIAGIGLGGASLVHRIQSHFASAADYTGSGSGDVTIQVHPGDTLSAIGKTLVADGVVASVEAFTDAASGNSRATSISPGFYRLHKRMQASIALDLLLDPASLVQSRVTIPEGRRMRDILGQLVKDTDITMPALRKAASHPSALGVPSWGAGHPLEGFLFPATY
ncbi:MAG TPA: endolytic transglycosylase MltG, partial [Mycobacteriales bacterium]|nr:endolytic transglycosylase MltG [Mycobacteriales bacterium]